MRSRWLVDRACWSVECSANDAIRGAIYVNRYVVIGVNPCTIEYFFRVTWNIYHLVFVMSYVLKLARCIFFNSIGIYTTPMTDRYHPNDDHRYFSQVLWNLYRSLAQWWYYSWSLVHFLDWLKLVLVHELHDWCGRRLVFFTSSLYFIPSPTIFLFIRSTWQNVIRLPTLERVVSNVSF